MVGRTVRPVTGSATLAALATESRGSVIKAIRGPAATGAVDLEAKAGTGIVVACTAAGPTNGTVGRTSLAVVPGIDDGKEVSDCRLARPAVVGGP